MSITPYKKSYELSPSSKGYIIFSVIFLIAGILVLSYGVYIVKKSFDSYNWPSVKGKIIFSQIGFRINNFSSGPSMYDNTPDKIYYSNIKYEYLINGLLYKGNSISASDHSSGTKTCLPFKGCKYSNPSEESFKKIIDKYPIGKEVSVYYNPQKPEDSLLEPGFKILILMIPIGGLIFILCAIILIKRYFNYKNSDNKN